MSIFGGSGTIFSFGPWGRVLPAHMREELIRFYQRGFGMAGAFLSGVSVGPVGVCTALCSGSPFFRTWVAGACLALGSSFGWDLALGMVFAVLFRAAGKELPGHLGVWGSWRREE